VKRFQYDITKHASNQLSELVYFCSAQGDCSLDQVPADQVGLLSTILNERGGQGWELVQLVFGKDGVVAFWKREVA
jgi:hypothetical protein